MLDYALRYAELGIPVVPLHGIRSTGGCTCSAGAACQSAGKHPRVLNWTAEATTDPGTIRGWFERWPDSNIGGATGHTFDVFDIDGDEGVAALGEMVDFNTPLPNSAPVSRTGSGGLHYFFLPTGAANSASKIGSHLDWRGMGGQVVLPPSRNAKGDYRWINPPKGPLPEAPGWLKEIVTRPSRVVTIDDAGPVEQRLFQNGSRNEDMRDLVWKLRQRQPDLSEKALFAAAWAHHTDPDNWQGAFEPLDEKTVRDMVKRAVAKPVERTLTPTLPEPAPAIAAADPTDRRTQLGAVLLSTVSTAPPEPLLLERLDPTDRTILYGTGGSGKGALTASWMAGLLEAGHRILVIDYENHPTEWARRLTTLLGSRTDLMDSVLHAAPLSSGWHGAKGGLYEQQADLLALAGDFGATYLVIDSLVPALLGADVMKPDAPSRWSAALEYIDLPSLSIGHIGKDNNLAYPFGSVFWHNLARVTWSLEQKGDQRVLVNRKHNNYEKTPALQVTLDWHMGQLADVIEVPLAQIVADTVSWAMRGLPGPATVAEITDAVNENIEDEDSQVAKGTVKKALERGSKSNPPRFKRDGSASNNATKWSLA